MNINDLAELDERDHARGAHEPAVLMVEYGDYDCPHTRAAQAIVDRLTEENPDLRVVFRAFPLRHIHVNAEILARVAEAAGRLGHFWPMHDHLMHHRSAIDETAVVEASRAVGLDIEDLTRRINDEDVVERVEQVLRRGQAGGVHSTPTFVFNGLIHDGHYDYDTLAARLARARGHGVQPRSAGARAAGARPKPT